MTVWTPQASLISEPYKVLLKRGEFVDPKRQNRAVPYKIYYPVDHGLEQMPVILWSHGFGGNRDGASFLSRFLAAQGYILVHLTHIGTDSSLWEGKDGHAWDILQKVKITRETTLNRMYDVPFVLDELEKLKTNDPEFGAFMDLNKIGMSGHSFGAMTTQVMAGMLFPDHDHALQNMRDDRISSGILYSPTPIGHLTDFSPDKIYSAIDIPLFHMTGTEDASPLESYGYEYRLVIHEHAGHPEQYLQVIDGGDHMIYNGTRGKLGVNPNREVHEEMVQHAAFAFWNAYLKDDQSAKNWLENTYRSD